MRTPSGVYNDVDYAKSATFISNNNIDRIGKGFSCDGGGVVVTLLHPLVVSVKRKASKPFPLIFGYAPCRFYLMELAWGMPSFCSCS